MLLGDSGTGKSHCLLIGLGVAACEQGRPVRYASGAQLVNELAEAADERRLSRIVARYGRLELMVDSTTADRWEPNRITAYPYALSLSTSGKRRVAVECGAAAVRRGD